MLNSICISCQKPMPLGAIPPIKFYLSFFPSSRSKLCLVCVQVVQVIRCIMCHNNLSLFEPSKNAQNTTRCKTSLLQYNLNHGSTSTKKHMLNKHLDKFVMYKFESRSTNGGEGGGERGKKACKKRNVW